MSKRTTRHTSWTGRLAILVAGLLLLAACGGTAAPELVVSTPLSVTAAATLPATEPPPATATATQTVDPTAPVTLPPPPTLPPTTVVVPTLPPTAPPTQEAVAPESEARYEVAFVTSDDTLNVRGGPGVTYDVVAELPPQTSDIRVETQNPTLIAGSEWAAIDAPAAAGWVNSQFLTQSVTSEAFCTDPAVSDLVNQLRQAIEAEDGRQLAALVHPNRDLRLHHDWWNPVVIIDGGDVDELFTDPTRYEWGREDGSGLPITGSFSDVMLPLLQRDLGGAQELACDDFLSGPTAGLVMLPDGYEPVRFYSLYRPAAEGEIEFDWGMWVVGVDLWQGEPYLRYLIHYDYEI